MLELREARHDAMVSPFCYRSFERSLSIVATADEILEPPQPVLKIVKRGQSRLKGLTSLWCHIGVVKPVMPYTVLGSGGHFVKWKSRESFPETPETLALP